jgi:hypothetical protein
MCITNQSDDPWQILLEQAESRCHHKIGRLRSSQVVRVSKAGTFSPGTFSSLVFAQLRLDFPIRDVLQCGAQWLRGCDAYGWSFKVPADALFVTRARLKFISCLFPGHSFQGANVHGVRRCPSSAHRPCDKWSCGASDAAAGEMKASGAGEQRGKTFFSSSQTTAFLFQTPPDIWMSCPLRYRYKS